MKTTTHILALVALLSCIACSYSPTIVRTPKGGYYVSGGASLLARQQIASATVETAEGDKITIQGVDNDSDDIGKAGVNWQGLGKVTGILEGTKRHAADQVTKQHGAEQATQQLTTTTGAEVVKHANGTNAALEIPAQIVTPKGY